jgi:ABC-type multidrug transport system fused ATPase/permease subunit
MAPSSPSVIIVSSEPNVIQQGHHHDDTTTITTNKDPDHTAVTIPEESSYGATCGGDEDLKGIWSFLATANEERQEPVVATLKLDNLKRFCFIFPIIKGITYPIFKVTLIALCEKLIRLAFETSLDPIAYHTLHEELYASVRNSKITSTYLMYHCSFFQIYGLAAGLAVVVAVVNPLANAFTENYLNYMEVKRLQGVLCDKLLMGSSTMDTARAQDLVYSKLTVVEQYWSDHKYKIVDDIASVVTGLGLLLVLAWDLSLLLFASAVTIFFAVPYIWWKLSTPWATHREIKVTQTNARLLDLLTCRDVVLSHTMELQEQDMLQAMMNSDRNEIHHLMRAKFGSQFVEYIFFTMLLPILFLYVRLTNLSMARVFQLLIVVVVLDEVLRAYLGFLKHGPPLQEYERAVKSLCEVLSMSREDLFPSEWAGLFGSSRTINCPDEYRHRSSQVEPRESSVFNKTRHFTTALENAPQEEDLISLQNVSLGYPQQDGTTVSVVENLNLDLEVGGHYAIMGESGAGKSTLLKALMGLIPTTGGSVSLSGKTVHTTSRSWRKQVAAVSQDSVLFNRTLRENLTYGLERGVTDSEIIAVLHKLNLADKLESLPQGLDTMITQNGGEFSGGQKQRLQIGRLLLSSKPIIVLDEVTSALDAQNTRDVISILHDFCVNKTLISVTHDIQTLSLVDTTIELRRGGEMDMVVNV